MLSHEELLRYSRAPQPFQMSVSKANRSLAAARVLLIGAGGLGSPAGLYLAAAGVGTLGIADFDVVDRSNLQRQILYGTSEIGTRRQWRRANDCTTSTRTSKSRRSLKRLSSAKRQSTSCAASTSSSMAPTNFPTRYLVNDACVLLGSRTCTDRCSGLTGRSRVFRVKAGSVLPVPVQRAPPPEISFHRVPKAACWACCRESSGRFRRLEVIKLIVGFGDPLIGRLLLFDGRKMQFASSRSRKIRLSRLRNSSNGHVR